ncbi:hypothetical protein FH972_019717 [Carpinus fangiana]|uniref:PGG domain-containing protein n=1 Tax=Carpinus fangiana TaxID=176857 RepID=A0A5N6RU82_9ROSI|nr:hypothetical protein FH972_019717 [Carpinus fangiana]
MAFQAGINPPGGVWQQNIYKPRDGFNYSEINEQVLYKAFDISHAYLNHVNDTYLYRSIASYNLGKSYSKI